MTKDEAMSRIRKLLALSENDGATQAEAERAAMHAQRLLREYQLSIADIKAGEVGEELSKEEVEMVGGRHHTWQYGLAEAVSTPLDCKCVFQKRYTNNYTASGNRIANTAITFIGYDSDVRVARYLFVYLERALSDMANKEGRERGRAGAQLISYKGGFIVGAASAIRQRLMAEKAEQERPAALISTIDNTGTISGGEAVPSNATALVLLKKPKVEEFFEREFPETVTVKAKGYADQSAHHHGRQAGEKIPLRKGVEGQTMRAITS